jgi:hypothetical protein
MLTNCAFIGIDSAAMYWALGALFVMNIMQMIFNRR